MLSTSLSSRIAVVYNLVQAPSSPVPLPSNWDNIIARFSNSYRQYSAGIAHDLILLITNPNPPTTKYINNFANLSYALMHYSGSGWDIGAYQSASRDLHAYDMVMFLNSQAFPVKHNWLLSFYRVFSLYGLSILGACSSFQIAPHIRTASLATSPTLLTDYPLTVTNRSEACLFEHSLHNFSLWGLHKGLPVGTVTTHGYTSLKESRNDPEIFRRGGQTALLIEDRHTLLYRNFDLAQKHDHEHSTDSTDYWNLIVDI